MMRVAIGKAVDVGEAVAWVEESLVRGGDAARLLSADLRLMSFALVTVSPARTDLDDLPLDNVGHGLPAAEADETMAQLFGEFSRTHPHTVVVVDDLRRRGDPHIGLAAYIGEQVIHWEDLLSPAAAARLLRVGASGFPLNAFVLRGAPVDLGLQTDIELSENHVDRLSHEVRAVIASVWDDESFVVVSRDAVADL